VNQQQFFETVLLALARNDVPFMLTGSVGAFAYGEPRLTNDMDVVVDLSPAKVDGLAREFSSKGYYFPPRAAVLAEILRRGQFNILHVESGSKVDLIIHKGTPFAHTEFARKLLLPFSPEFDSPTATAEDIIISKLDYFRRGGSQKHLSDILGILRVSGETLNLSYLATWVGRLDLNNEWQQVLKAHGS